MSDLIFGFWQKPADINADETDYLWIGDNGRMVHRINYKHGPFVMTLWSKNLEGETYEVKLKPKSDGHRVVLSSDGATLSMEHLDLNNPKAVFERIGEDKISDDFIGDLAWAAKNMDKLEKK